MIKVKYFVKILVFICILYNTSGFVYGEENYSFEIKAGYDDVTKVGYTPIKISVYSTNTIEVGELNIIQGYNTDNPLVHTKKVHLKENVYNKYIFNIYLRSKNEKLVINLKSDNNILLHEIYEFDEIIDIGIPVIGVVSNKFADYDFLNNINLPTIYVDKNNSYYKQKDNIDSEDSIKVVNIEKGKILSDNYKGFDLFDVIIMNDFSRDFFTKKQYDALEKWINDGGSLIIATGENGYKTMYELDKRFRLCGFGRTYTSYTDLIELQNYVGVALVEEEFKMYDVDNVVGDVILEYNKNPIIMGKDVGKGSISMLSFNPISYNKNNTQWKEKLFKELILINEYKFGKNSEQSIEITNSLQKISKNIPIKQQSFLVFVIIVISCYIILIGPIVFIIIKKRENRDHLWWILPAAAVLIAVMIYFLDFKAFLKRPLINAVSLIEINDNLTANLDSHINILNNTNDLMKINYGTKENFHLISSEKTQLKESFVIGPMVDYIVDGTKLWERNPAIGEKSIDILGDLNISSYIEDKTVKILVENKIGFNLQDAFLIIDKKYISLGNLNYNSSKIIRYKSEEKYLNLREYLNNVYKITNENEDTRSKEYLENNRIKDILNVICKNNAFLDQSNESGKAVIIGINYIDYWSEIKVNDFEPKIYNTNIVYKKFDFDIKKYLDNNPQLSEEGVN